VLLTYGDSGDIVLRGKGSGGLSEMKKKMNDNKMYVGVIRVRAVDDFGSTRAKFVYINYVGVNVVRLSWSFGNIFSCLYLANITCCSSFNS
jgi:hypothetical protein